MTSDPAYDAAVHFDALAERDEYIERCTAIAREEIEDTFIHGIRKVAPASLNLVAVEGRSGRLIRVTLADAVSDAIGYGKPLASLLAALHLSDCPHVAALRKVLADDYADSHADEIGMAMEGDE